MPEFKLADYGVIGFVLLIILVIALKLPEIVASRKTEDNTTTNTALVQEAETTEMLQKLTDAITKLTIFLETDTAVNKEKDKALYKQIDELHEAMIYNTKLTEALIKTLDEHCIKCSISCQNKINKG